MATTRDILGIQLQIENTAGIKRDLYDTLVGSATAASASWQTQFSKNIKKIAEELDSSLTDAIASAALHGVKDVKKLEDAFYKSSQPLISALEEAKRLEGELAVEQDANKKRALTMQLNALNKVAEEQKKNQDRELKNLTKVYKMAEAADEARTEALDAQHKQMMDDAKEYHAFFAKGFAEKTEAAVEGFGDLLQKTVSLDLKSAFAQGGKFFRQMGMGMQARAGGSGAQAGIGQALAGVGKALAIVGAVAGGLAMLVKVMLDADSQTKEFNKEIVKSAGALDLVGKGGMDASTHLDRVRKSAIGATTAFNPLPGAITSTVKEVINLGVSAKEFMEITGKFAEVGVSYKEMERGATNTVDAMKNYTTYVKAAARNSRMFGEDLGTMAEKMGENMKDLGLSLEEVSDGFAMIGKEAQNSGYGTKRFFNMVLQATSGITMYNVRLGGTAKLLGQLTRILGLKTGGALLQQMQQSISNESYQDRYKRIMTTGTGLTKNILTKEANIQAGEIKRAMGSADVKSASGLMTPAAKEFALKMDKLGNADLVKQMAGLSDKDRRSLLSGLRSTGKEGDEALARRMDAFIKVSKGTSGKMADMADGIEGLSAGGKMVMEINRMTAVIGKPLHEMNMIERMAYQQQSGMSTEQIEQLRRVSETVHGDFEMAKRAAKTAEESPEKLAELNKQLEKTGMKLAFETDKSGKQHAKIIGKDSEEAINNANDAMLNWERTSKEEETKALQSQEEISKEIAQNTLALTDLMQSSMISIMEEIASYVSKILIFLGLKGDDTGLKKAVEDQTRESEKQSEALNQQIEQEREKVKYLQKQTGGTDSEKKARIDAIAAGQASIQGMMSEKAELSAKRRAAMSMASGAGDARKGLFNTLQAGGMSSADALTRVGGLSEEEAAKAAADIQSKRTSAKAGAGQLAFEKYSQAMSKGSAAAAQAGPAAYTKAAEEELDKNALALATKEFDEQQKAVKDGNKNMKDTEKIQKDTEVNKKVLQDMYDLEKRREEKGVREDVVKSLKEKFPDKAEAIATLTGLVGDKEKFGAEFGKFKGTLTPEEEAKLKGLPAFAEGGVVNRPTIALVGEKGPEAIVPLGKGMGATVVQNIYANGDLSVIRREVASGLRDFYGVTRGATA